MENPLVSIIVPVYNVEKYLRECLDSLIAQTYRNIEIVCFNDASTDNSLKILNEYANNDCRIKIINSLTNVKQGGGRNRGIVSSRGEYICFVDSDDWVDKRFVEKLYNALTRANADIATADYYVYDNGKLNEIYHLEKNLRCSSLELKKRILLNGCRLWTSIFKRSLIIDNNLFFPEGVIYEDNAIAPALFLSAAKIVKIDDNLYFYRKNTESTTHIKNDYRFFDRLQTSVLAIENIKRLPNYSSELRVLDEEIDWMFIKVYLINTVSGCISAFSPIPYDRIKRVFHDIKQYVPNWRKNKYYQTLVDRSNRVKLNLLSVSPFVGIKLISLMQKLKKMYRELPL